MNKTKIPALMELHVSKMMFYFLGDLCQRSYLSDKPHEKGKEVNRSLKRNWH